MNDERDDGRKDLLSMGFDKRSVETALSRSGSFDEALRLLLDWNENEIENEVENETPARPIVSFDTPFHRPENNDPTDRPAPNPKPTAPPSPFNERDSQVQELLRTKEILSRDILLQREYVLSFTRPPYTLRNDALEELYLFLKEMVHANQDLHQHKDRIHEYVFSRMEASHSGLIPCLIELLVLENEDLLLLRGVRDLLEGVGEDVDETENDGAEDHDDEEDGHDYEEDGHDYEEDGHDYEEDGRIVSSSDLDAIHERHSEELAVFKRALEEASGRELDELQGAFDCRQQRNDGQNTDEDAFHKLQSTASADRQTLPLNELQARQNRRNRAIVSGMKRKHIKIVGRIQALKADETQIGGHATLDYDAVHDEVVSELKVAYLEDMANLQSRIEDERQRQQDALRDRLRLKRNEVPRLGSGDGRDRDEEEKTEEYEMGILMDTLNSKFEREMEKAIQEPIDWLAGGLIGASRFVESPQNTEQNARVDTTREMIDMYSIHTADMSHLQQTLYREKMRQETDLQKRLSLTKHKMKTDARLDSGTQDNEQEGDDKFQDMEERVMEHFQNTFRDKNEKIQDILAEFQISSALNGKNDQTEQHRHCHVEEEQRSPDSDPSLTDGPGRTARMSFDLSELLESLKEHHDNDRTRLEQSEVNEKERQKLRLQKRRAHKKMNKIDHSDPTSNDNGDERGVDKEEESKEGTVFLNGKGSDLCKEITNWATLDLTQALSDTIVLQQEHRTSNTSSSCSSYKGIVQSTRTLLSTLVQSRKQTLESLKETWKNTSKTDATITHAEYLDSTTRTLSQLKNRDESSALEEYKILEAHVARMKQLWHRTTTKNEEGDATASAEEEARRVGTLLNVPYLIQEIMKDEGLRKERDAFLKLLLSRQRARERNVPPVRETTMTRMKSSFEPGSGSGRDASKGDSGNGNSDALLRRITKQHLEERETLEITLDLEQARQRQVLQQRLLAKKGLRRISHA